MYRPTLSGYRRRAEPATEPRITARLALWEPWRDAQCSPQAAAFGIDAWIHLTSCRSWRASLLAFATTDDELIRHYTFSEFDLASIKTFVFLCGIRAGREPSGHIRL